MASVNLKKGKCDKGKALYGIPRHNYRDSKNHSNKDIDPSRSHLNKHYGPQTSAEFRDRLREMIKAADEKKPPKRRKKDRQVMLAAVIPSPREGMTAEQEAAWSAKTWDVMQELFGDQIVGATYHADEIHKYTDPHDKQEHISRGHTHYSLLPWTDEHGLNMDKFYRRDLPNRINEALDKACMEMFGIQYRDGTGKKGEKTVEELKYDSKIAALDNQVDNLQNDVLDMQDTINDKRATIASLDAEIKAKQKEAEKVAEEVYQPYRDAQERLMKQFKSLTPKQQKAEKSEIEKLLEQSNRVFGDLGKMRKVTAALTQVSNRIDADYLSLEDDDDYER